MARQIFRAFPLYVNGKKIAEVSSGTYDVNPNDEAQVGTEGYMGHADGATITRIQATCMIPVVGMQVQFDAIIKARQYVQVGVPINGKFQQVDMRITQANYKWNFKNGQAEGDFTLEGGEPDLV